jgi:hypothetical protein
LDPVKEEDTEDYGDAILKSESERRVKSLRENEASEIDNVPAELIRSSGVRTEDKLYERICWMYETGECPLDFKRNILIPITKTAGAKKMRRTSCNKPNIYFKITYKNHKEKNRTESR